MPTWYGVELKGNFEDNSGMFLNPESNTPTNGLYNVGVSLSLARGLLINQRMAALKQAKLYQKQAQIDRQLFVNKIIYNASIAYFNWLNTYRKKQVYEDFLANAELRYKNIKRSYELGENPAIDTTEARIIFNDRKLNLEKVNLNYVKASLELSNYLWVNNVPIELTNAIFPDTQITTYVDEALQLTNHKIDSIQFNHPKLNALNFKLESLEVERRLKRNNLLPKVDLQYNFLSQQNQVNSFNLEDYKTSVTVSFPLFLRKERANLKLTTYQLKAIDYEQKITALALKNQLNAVQQEIIAYENQIGIANNIVLDYAALLKGEERKFETGESSLFLINTREAKLIENKIKAIDLENSLLNSKGKLFNALGL